MLRQNKFSSTITIIGTALAMMMIMTLIVADVIKTISIAPEKNRSRTLYANYIRKSNLEDTWSRSGSLTYDMVKDYLLKLETPELISVDGSTYTQDMVTTENLDRSKESRVKLTDDAYWKIMDFSFVAGKPFTHEEFRSGVRNAIVSESTARELFPGQDAMGKTIMIKHFPYNITGIVKDVSPVFKNAYGDIWTLYSSLKDYDKERGFSCTLLMLAKNKKDLPAIIAEVKECEVKYTADNPEEKLFIAGPHSVKFSGSNIRGNNQAEVEEFMKKQRRQQIFIFAVLLLVPAVNLSGFSLTQIKKRMSEIGIRKAFGAKRRVILVQVLYENFITSLIGGIIGLILSYFVIILMRNFILGIGAEQAIPFGALVSWPVFLAVFVGALLINLLSAGIPAYRASRINIVNSINQNDK